MNGKSEFILLRGPRTDDDGNSIPIEVKIVRADNVDLTGYSFLESQEKYDVWVPTKELEYYQKWKSK